MSAGLGASLGLAFFAVFAWVGGLIFEAFHSECFQWSTARQVRFSRWLHAFVVLCLLPLFFRLLTLAVFS